MYDMYYHLTFSCYLSSLYHHFSNNILPNCMRTPFNRAHNLPVGSFVLFMPTPKTGKQLVLYYLLFYYIISIDKFTSYIWLKSLVEVVSILFPSTKVDNMILPTE